MNLLDFEIKFNINNNILFILYEGMYFTKKNEIINKGCYKLP